MSRGFSNFNLLHIINIMQTTSFVVSMEIKSKINNGQGSGVNHYPALLDYYYHMILPEISYICCI